MMMEPRRTRRMSALLIEKSNWAEWEKSYHATTSKKRKSSLLIETIDERVEQHMRLETTSERSSTCSADTSKSE